MKINYTPKKTPKPIPGGTVLRFKEGGQLYLVIQDNRASCFFNEGVTRNPRVIIASLETGVLYTAGHSSADVLRDYEIVDETFVVE